jgi:imidazolonepropionase-like amidohydrolase
VRQSLVQRAVSEVKAFHEAGGLILFGTDGGLDRRDPTKEYQLMQRAGLDWRAILASMTTAPAKRFGYSARKGRIAKGMDADLVLLDQDPATDVTAFHSVRDTIRGGQIIYERK